MAQQPQANAPKAQFVSPNLWTLSGSGINIRYSSLALPGPAGGPHLIYHDSHRTLNFSGNQLRTQELPDLGTLVSVTLQIVPDLGTTTFTLLLPRVNLPLQGAVSSIHVETDGITTMHSTPFAPISHGQVESYTIVRLTGTASHVRTE